MFGAVTGPAAFVAPTGLLAVLAVEPVGVSLGPAGAPEEGMLLDPPVPAGSVAV
jgi:hypothetical protein